MLKLELRQNYVHCEGYVCVPMRESRVLRDNYGPFIEQVAVGCFAKALQANDCQVWINHDHAVEARNYALFEDNVGLRFEGDIYDPDIIAAAQSDEISGWSYGFTCNKDSWETRDDMRYRTLEDINLFEVSLLIGKTPAYYATSVYCRDDEALTKEYRYEENQCNSDERGVSFLETPCEGISEKETPNETAACGKREDEPDVPECPDDDSEDKIKFEQCIINCSIEILKLKQII